MKKISFVFSAVFYIILQSGAQNTIVKTNSTWSVLEYGTILAGGSGEMPQQTICCIGTEEITIRNDSTYNEREYKKVFSNIGIKNKFRGLIREEDQKIFFIRQNLLHEHLLYDFSIENGEMIAITDTGGTEISLYAVVDEIIVNEVIKKRKEIDYRIELIKNEVGPFEEYCEKYYLNYLEKFFQKFAPYISDENLKNKLKNISPLNNIF